MDVIQDEGDVIGASREAVLRRLGLRQYLFKEHEDGPAQDCKDEA
jgi:hypothetical protein